MGTATEEPEATLAKVIPNPTQGTVKWLWDGNPHKTRLSLFDARGQLLATYSQTLELSLADYPTGIYLLSLETPTQRFWQRVLRY